MVNPGIVINPGRLSGKPTIGESRLDVETIILQVWAGTNIDHLAEDFAITRESILEACWFAGTYGITGTHKGKVYGRVWRTRWQKWAEENHRHMWIGDWHLVTHPPTK